MFAKRKIRKYEEIFFNYGIEKNSFNEYGWARQDKKTDIKATNQSNLIGKKIDFNNTNKKSDIKLSKSKSNSNKHKKNYNRIVKEQIIIDLSHLQEEDDEIKEKFLLFENNILEKESADSRNMVKDELNQYAADADNFSDNSNYLQEINVKDY